MTKKQAEKQARRRVYKPKLEPKLEPEPELEPKEFVMKKTVVFEKHKVLKILGKGHTKTHFHCEMSGGFTQHVPKRLFSND